MNTVYGEGIENKDELYCFCCGKTLVSDKVFLNYLTNTFPTQLLKCPECGLIFIDEDMVMTKAVEVERTIEDK